MKLKKYLLLLLLTISSLWGIRSQAQTVTPQWKAGTGYILNFYPGKSPIGYDTLGYVGYLRNLFKLKSDSVNDNGYITHGYFDAHSPIYTGSNGITEVGNDFTLGGTLTDFTYINFNGGLALNIGDFEMGESSRYNFGSYNFALTATTDFQVNYSRVYADQVSAQLNSHTPTKDITFYSDATNGARLDDSERRGIKYLWNDDSNLGDSSLVPKRYITSARLSDSTTVANTYAHLNGSNVFTGNQFYSGDATFSGPNPVVFTQGINIFEPTKLRFFDNVNVNSHSLFQPGIGHQLWLTDEISGDITVFANGTIKDYNTNKFYLKAGDVPDSATISNTYAHLTGNNNFNGNQIINGNITASNVTATSDVITPELLLASPGKPGFSLSSNSTYTALRAYDAIGSDNGYQLRMNANGQLVYENWNTPSGTTSLKVNGVITATGAPVAPTDVVRLQELSAQTAILDSKVDTTVHDVVITMGQSNAQAAHGDSTQSTKTVPGTAIQYYNGKIKVANDPVGNAITGSPWPAFAARYYKLTGRKILFVPRAKGGSAMCPEADIGQGNWSSSGTLRYQARDTVAAAIAAAKAAGYKIGKIFILWHQGEQDAFPIFMGTETAKMYRDTLTDFISFWRGYYPKIPFYILRISKTNSGTDYFKAVRDADETVALADTWTQVVSRSSYGFKAKGWMYSDGLHYLQPGLNYMGDEAAQNVVQVEKSRTTYNIFDKTGFGVNTPLAFSHIAGGNDTTSSVIVNKGKTLLTPIEGAYYRDGLHEFITDSTLTVRQKLTAATSAGIPRNNITFADLNGFLTSDTTFQYNGTSLGIGVKPGTYSASSRVYIKGLTTGTESALNIYDSGNTPRYRFLNNGQFIIQAGGAFNVGGGSGGIATTLLQGLTTSNTDFSLVVTNSSTPLSSTAAIAVRNDKLVDFNGGQMVRIPNIAGDPGFVSDRGIWYNSSIAQFRGRRNGATISFASNPNTTLGDLSYAGVSGVETRLPGNTTTTTKFLTSTGNGTVSAAPAYFDLFGSANTWGGNNTFSVSPIVPNATIASQAVAFGQLGNYIDNSTNQTGIAGNKTWTGAATFTSNILLTGAGNIGVHNGTIYSAQEASGFGVFSDLTGTKFTAYRRDQISYISPSSSPLYIAYPSAQSVTATINWPTDKSGTVALTSDISTLDNVLSKTANYTIVSGDFVTGKNSTLDLYVDATNGNVTITMPSAVTFAGYTIYITKTDTSANTVTINTVLGGNTLLSQYQDRQYRSNSTSWYNH